MEGGYRKISRASLIVLGKNTSPFSSPHPPSAYRKSAADVGFRYSMITYPNYKYYFPVKALGMYQKRFGDEELLL